MAHLKHRLIPCAQALAVSVLLMNPQSSLADDEAASASETQTVKGKVIRVIDGDSVVVKTEAGDETIHLDGIDAPEFKQAGGDKATSFLKKLVYEKSVEVRWDKKDNYGRILGTVYDGDKNVNLEMIAKGWAWHFERYNKSEQFAEAQKAAKEAKLGLWEESEPTPPWDFRKNNPREAK